MGTTEMTDHENNDYSAGGIAPAEEDLLGPDLRALLSSLPKELAPERDLSEEIASLTWNSLPAGKAREGAADTRRRPKRVWSLPKVQLAAAAVALIVISSATTAYLVRKQAERSVDATATMAETTNQAGERDGYRFAGYSGMEKDYADAIEDLTLAFEAQRDRLPVETVQLIEENLRIIDAAIEQSLAALGDAPQSLPLQQAVMTSYETKLDFLRRAAAITADG